MNLPANVLNFVLWWLIRTPRKFLLIGGRGLRILDNSSGLILSLRHFFTPLFGDFTIIGRLMGLIYRVIKVLIGLFLFLLFLTSIVIFIIFWYLIPAILFGVFDWYSFIVYPICFLVYELVFSSRPIKKISQLKAKDDARKCVSFNKSLLRYFELSKLKFMDELFSDNKMFGLLLILELSSNEFYKEFGQNVQRVGINSEDLLYKSLEFAKENKSRFIEVEHLFLAIVDFLPNKESFLAKYKTSLDSIKDGAFWVVQEREDLSKIFFWQEDYTVPPMGGVNRANTSRVTPTLNSVSTDYTHLARMGMFDKVVGKEKATKELIDALSGNTSADVLLIGDPGSGKTTLIKGLAQQIIQGTNAPALQFKRLVALDSGSLISGLKTPGEISERVGKIINEIKDAGNIILFIDEIHTLVGSSMGDSAELSSVFNSLEPQIASSSLQIIGATSTPSYRKYVEPNGAFNRLFKIVRLEEASPVEALDVLKVMAKKFKNRYKVTVSYMALKRAVELSTKLIKDRVLPDKAVVLLEQACIDVSTSTKHVTSEDISRIVSIVTKVPVSAISDDESNKLLNIEKEMSQRVVGQHEALDQVGDAIRRARAGIRDEKKPIASFLFVGPTGVGKTETAKALGDVYFGGESTIIRVDMSEYQRDDSTDKLIGTSDGKILGYLTERVRQAPFSLILLDEIEKASTKVTLLFLQVLDDGRLTDSTGRTIDFTNSIIISTSNVGTSKIQEVASRDGKYDEMKKTALAEVRDKFAPEFLNRFTGIVVFRPLEPDDVRIIAIKQLGRVSRMSEAKGVRLSFKPELIDRLAKDGFDREWGARPLNRLIESTVESYLAKKLLSSELKGGDLLDLGLEVFDKA